MDEPRRLNNMNWSAVHARFLEIDEQQSKVLAAVAALELRLTAAISQMHGVMQDVQALKAREFGTGPSEKRK